MELMISRVRAMQVTRAVVRVRGTSGDARRVIYFSMFFMRDLRELREHLTHSTYTPPYCYHPASLPAHTNRALLRPSALASIAVQSTNVLMSR